MIGQVELCRKKIRRLLDFRKIFNVHLSFERVGTDGRREDKRIGDDGDTTSDVKFSKRFLNVTIR